MNLVELLKPSATYTQPMTIILPILFFQAQAKDYFLHNNTVSDLIGYDWSWDLVNIKILIHKSGLRPGILHW